jgi:hypothetical protein
VALTLRALGGLATEDIARAFLVSEQTMKRRLSRAKIKATAIPFAVLADRLRSSEHWPCGRPPGRTCIRLGPSCCAAWAARKRRGRRSSATSPGSGGERQRAAE